MRKESYYFYGEEGILHDKSLKLSIVGSRSVVPYTKLILDELFDEIKYFDICIVSGGMYGVDMYAHNLALAHNMKTIFVLPQGIDSYKNSSLFNQIKFKENSKFLFLSEYGNTFNCKKYMFLERNKIIVQIADLVFIAQASLKSGSISTGRYSKKISKRTLCVPFSLENRQFQGTNYLIDEGLSIYLNPNSVLQNLNLSCKNSEISIKNLLKEGPSSMDKLLIETGYESSLLENKLLKLILEGEIFYDGERYSI